MPAEKAGADGALILPPYFVKLTDDEIFAHYRDVGRSGCLPTPSTTSRQRRERVARAGRAWRRLDGWSR